MITMYTARTAEVDVFDEAIAEIKSQIDLNALKKHSCGIIFCCMDYNESGMMKALCDALPFDVIGMTSMGTTDSRGYGFFDLTLTVLTSDEVQFKAGMVKDINRMNYEEKINELYGGIRAEVNGDPSFILSFTPLFNEVAGYEMVAAADRAVNGVPIWGSMSSSINFTPESVSVMCNGEYSNTGLTMMFFCGVVKPRFVLTSLPEYSISNMRGIITKSDGAVLIEINDMPVLEYLSYLGVEVTTENIRATPLMVYHEGTKEPVALAFYEAMENGRLFIGGAVPEGASISIGGIDNTTIVESCEQGLKEILEMENRHATLLLPCVTRGVMMAPDQEGEMKLIHETLSKSGLPFAMGYSGGEISPMTDTEGKMHNRFHNYTFCACIL
jgi:hypothetical protein